LFRGAAFAQVKRSVALVNICCTYAHTLGLKLSVSEHSRSHHANVYHASPKSHVHRHTTAHKRTHACTHARTRAHTHTRTRTRTHARTHTHTHTHTHASPSSHSRAPGLSSTNSRLVQTSSGTSRYGHCFQITTLSLSRFSLSFGPAPCQNEKADKSPRFLLP